jgi:hypothetical protein
MNVGIVRQNPTTKIDRFLARVVQLDPLVMCRGKGSCPGNLADQNGARLECGGIRRDDRYICWAWG